MLEASVQCLSMAAITRSYRSVHVAQSVTCLATDACPTANPGVASAVPAWTNTFVEIHHQIISTVISSLPLNHSRRVVVS